jgi:RNA polymerase sigma-70 factor (ECF subfamily)
MCGRDAADDVVQDTFLAVLRGPGPSTALRTGGYDPAKGSVGNYLFGIARHFVLKRLSARDVVTFELNEDDLSAGALAEAERQPTVLDSMSRAETVQAVRAAIASLPAPYREAIVLCELQEMSYADAASVAQCPVGTVRSRLHRAKALLLTKLSASAKATVDRAATQHVEVGLRKSI